MSTAHPEEGQLPASPGRKLTLLPLVMVLFFSVSGGAYGLENIGLPSLSKLTLTFGCHRLNLSSVPLTEVEAT